MAQSRDLEKAVDYLIDETPEGAPFREGKVFVCGHFVEKKADPPRPPHVRGSEVIRIGTNSAGEATIWFRPEDPGDLDREVRADLYRLSELQPRGLEDLRRRFALPLIVRACAEGRWKADGKEPGSAKREDIRARDFIGSEIDQYSGDLMSTPGSTSTRPESTVAIWTELMFTVSDGIPQPERISQAPVSTAPVFVKKGVEQPGAATGGADEGKAAGTKGGHAERRQDEDQPPDGEQDQPSRREQRKTETKAKYERWYQMAQEIKSGRKDDKPLSPIGICTIIAERERKAGRTKANTETIKRRLNADHRGWAG